MNGFHPKSLKFTNIIPALLTVAGEATAKSYTSNTRPTCGGSEIRSPLSNVNTLLSSSTVFID